MKSIRKFELNPLLCYRVSQKIAYEFYVPIRRNDFGQFMQLNHPVKVNLSNLGGIRCFAAWQEIGHLQEMVHKNKYRIVFLIVLRSPNTKFILTVAFLCHTRHRQFTMASPPPAESPPSLQKSPPSSLQKSSTSSVHHCCHRVLAINAATSAPPQHPRPRQSCWIHSHHPYSPPPTWISGIKHHYITITWTTHLGIRSQASIACGYKSGACHTIFLLPLELYLGLWYRILWRISPLRMSIGEDITCTDQIWLTNFKAIGLGWNSHLRPSLCS